jgi:hypothetical protein
MFISREGNDNCRRKSSRYRDSTNERTLNLALNELVLGRCQIKINKNF